MEPGALMPINKMLLLGAAGVALVACGEGSRESSGDASAQEATRSAASQGLDAAAASGERGSVPIVIAADIDGDEHRARGNGSCSHAEQASIRGVPSQMWQVQYRGGDGGISHLNLTMWRPQGGGVDQVSFSAQTESGSHRIDTVVGSELTGSGVVMLRPDGEGIRVTLDGRDADGKPLRLTISCARVTPAIAEGG
jgi:hypothetical protein